MFHLVSFWWISRTQYITSIGLNYNVWEVSGVVSDLWRVSGGYAEEIKELVFRELFFVGNKPEIIRCARSPWSPIDTIRRGHDGSWSILTSSHRHEDTVSISDSFQIVCISPSWRVFIRQSWRVCSTRSPWSPIGSIRRGEDGSWSTNNHEGTVSVDDII